MKTNLQQLCITLCLLLFEGVSSVWAEADSKNFIAKCTSTENFYREENSNISSFSDFDATNGTIAFTLAEGKTEFRFGATIPSDYVMNNSDTYFVFEATNLSTSSNKAKMDAFTLVDGDNTYNYEYKDGNGCRFSKITLQNSILYIVSPMADNAAYRSMSTGIKLQSWFEANATVNLRTFRFIFDAASAGATVEVKRAGFYTLSEIISMYPTQSDGKYIKWRLAYPTYPWIESDGVDDSKNNLRINNKGSEALSLEKAKFILSTFGNPSCNMDLRYMYWSDTPYKEDLLAQFTNSPKILLTRGEQQKVPTMNLNTFVTGSRYYAYKDGSLSVNNKQDGTTYTDYSYTRKLISGYSSCCLPFDISASELTTGLTAYTFSNCDADGKVTFVKTDETISAGTPFVLKAEEAGIYLIKSAETPNLISSPSNYYPTTTSNNVKFVGSFVNEVPSGDYASTTNFGITVDGRSFAKMNPTTKTTYFRAFLADGRSSSQGAKAYVPAFVNDETTDIDNINSGNTVRTRAEGIYTIDGRCVSKEALTNSMLPKGIYIVNGKKVVVK